MTRIPSALYTLLLIVKFMPSTARAGRSVYHWRQSVRKLLLREWCWRARVCGASLRLSITRPGDVVDVNAFLSARVSVSITRDIFLQQSTHHHAIQSYKSDLNNFGFWSTELHRRSAPNHFHFGGLWNCNVRVDSWCDREWPADLHFSNDYYNFEVPAHRLRNFTQVLNAA